MAKEISVFDATGKRCSSLALSVNLKEQVVNRTAYATAIRVLLQNWRQGTVGCKSRGEVAFSNRKPWKQKGTGRARVGSLRSPLWRKGGIIFGPQPRVRSLAINKDQRKKVLNNLFFGMLNADRIHSLDFEFDAKPNTKKAAELLRKTELMNKKVLVFLSAHDDSAYASFRNIPYVNIVYFDHPNAFDLSNTDCWLFLKKDSQLFNEMVEKWN